MQPRQSFKRRSSSILILSAPTICWSRLILRPTNFRRQLANCRRELSKNPNNAPALMTLALVYERMQDYPKARDAYEKLLSIKPDFVPALNNLAYLYTEHLNDLDKAYELARKARDLQAKTRRSAIPLAGFFTNAATISRPCRFCRRALKKLPTIRRFNFTWA